MTQHRRSYMHVVNDLVIASTELFPILRACRVLLLQFAILLDHLVFELVSMNTEVEITNRK